MIIDWQHHFSPKEIAQKRGGKVGQAVFEKGVVGLYIMEEVYNIDKQLKFMDETGIDMSVLSATLREVEDCKLTDDAYAKSDYRAMARLWEARRNAEPFKAWLPGQDSNPASCGIFAALRLAITPSA